MPKYRVQFERTVNQIATHEIEAESMEAARETADTLADGYDPAALAFNWVDDPTNRHANDVDWEQVELVE